MIIGLIFICLGIYCLLKIFISGFDINLTWNIVLPLIFILMGISNMAKFKKIDLFNIVMIILGIIFLLSGLNVIPKVDYRVIGAAILIMIGISITCSNFKNKATKEMIEKNESKKLTNYNGIFSGTKEKVTSDDFEGTNIYSIFGGVQLDISDCKIKNDIVINAYGVFGGVDIIMPNNVNIVIKSNSIFGGVENKTHNKHDDKNKTIYINATAVFGGVELK